MDNPIEVSPLSHIKDVRRIKQAGETIKVQPKKPILIALAKAHGLIEITRFDAKLVLRPWRKNGAKLIGQFHADVIHPCSVTLKPVPQSITAEFETNFAPLSAHKQMSKPKIDIEDGALLLDFEDDEPDYFEGASIDIGATLEEFFALELTPYPRADDASLPHNVVLGLEDIEDDKPSPFAALANWNKNNN